MADRDLIHAELIEIEALLDCWRRTGRRGAQQALRHVLDPDTWHPASQTFYRGRQPP